MQQLVTLDLMAAACPALTSLHGLAGLSNLLRVSVYHTNVTVLHVLLCGLCSEQLIWAPWAPAGMIWFGLAARCLTRR